MYDVCVIGAGVVGLNIARELAKYKLKLCVLDKEDDVSCGCSKANSGIVHGGYSDEPGTLKAKLCVRGNHLYEELNKELHFGYRRTGSLVLAFENEEIAKLQQLYEKGTANGVEGLKILSPEEVVQKEPHVNKNIKAALFCENAGVTSPYEFVIALAENAITNGVDIKLQSEVVGINNQNSHFEISTGNGETIMARYVVNAAGIYSDKIANMLGITKYTIVPRRGQYLLLDKEESYLAQSVIFQVPTALGKGILVTTTYHGNLMIGPNAEEIEDKEDIGTDEKTLKSIVQSARKSVPAFNIKKVLKSFAGNRPVANVNDWVIRESQVKRFINLIGIDSPGLTSSPAIALEVKEILQQAGLALEPNFDFISERKPIIKAKNNTFLGSLDSTNPEEHIICRCEQVTEAEIVDCLHRGIPIRSLDAVSRRTRAGHGRCQGAFCGPRVKKLMAETLHISVEDIKSKSNASSLLAQRVKGMELRNL